MSLSDIPDLEFQPRKHAVTHPRQRKRARHSPAVKTSEGPIDITVAEPGTTTRTKKSLDYVLKNSRARITFYPPVESSDANAILQTYNGNEVYVKSSGSEEYMHGRLGLLFAEFDPHLTRGARYVVKSIAGFETSDLQFCENLRELIIMRQP